MEARLSSDVTPSGRSIRSVHFLLRTFLIFGGVGGTLTVSAGGVVERIGGRTSLTGATGATDEDNTRLSESESMMEHGLGNISSSFCGEICNNVSY